MDGRIATTIRAMANETRILIQKLSDVKVNEVVTDEELKEWIGKNCRPGNPGYGYLQSALHALIREGIVFDRVRMVGLKRMDDIGKLSVGGSYIGRCHRSALKGAKITAAAEYNNLPRDKKTLHNLQLAWLQTLGHASKPAMQKRLIAATEKRGGLLPTAEVLEQFR